MFKHTTHKTYLLLRYRTMDKVGGLERRAGGGTEDIHPRMVVKVLSPVCLLFRTLQFKYLRLWHYPSIDSL